MADAVGFIGLGAMGKPMALNLRKHDVAVVVHNRSQAAERALAEAGASVATTPAAIAAASQHIVLMLPDAPDVEAVMLGPSGLLASLQPGSVVVDSSTIAPSAAHACVRPAIEPNLPHLGSHRLRRNCCRGVGDRDCGWCRAVCGIDYLCGEGEVAKGVWELAWKRAG